MIQILQGDWVERLRELPEASVHCCVTSPPYWGLRDYGVAGQLGLEKSPQEYVEKLVAGFREVYRVMRDDGTLWVNLGDAYCGGGNYRGCNESTLTDKQRSNRGAHGELAIGRTGHPPPTLNIIGLSPKNLIGMPWRVAFALQDAGWILRSDIIWHKPNPMPESVTDRPTKAHEYIFLFSKRAKYYYDAEAIKEPSSPNSHARIAQENFWNQQGGEKDYRNGVNGNRSMRNTLENWARKANGKNSRMVVERAAGREDSKPNPSRSHVPGVGPKSAPAGSGIKNNESMSAALIHMLPDRNKRTVWTVATAPYREAHFATFPPDLIKPCILAGCPAGGTVLDPFAGSGTTGEVALELGRSAVLIELNPKYVAMIRDRTNVTPGLALA